MLGLVPLHAQSHLGSRGLSCACWASAISPLSLIIPLPWVRLHGDYFWALKISVSLKLLCHVVSFLSWCLSSSRACRNHLYDLWTCVKVGIAILVDLEWGLRFYILTRSQGGQHAGPQTTLEVISFYFSYWSQASAVGWESYEESKGHQFDLHQWSHFVLWLQSEPETPAAYHGSLLHTHRGPEEVQWEGTRAPIWRPACHTWTATGSPLQQP